MGPQLLVNKSLSFQEAKQLAKTGSISAPFPNKDTWCLPAGSPQDHFGVENSPGVINQENWSLRIQDSFIQKSQAHRSAERWLCKTTQWNTMQN